jgi:hypothetical protein
MRLQGWQLGDAPNFAETCDTGFASLFHYDTKLVFIRCLLEKSVSVLYHWIEKNK